MLARRHHARGRCVCCGGWRRAGAEQGARGVPLEGLAGHVCGETGAVKLGYTRAPRAPCVPRPPRTLSALPRLLFGADPSAWTYRQVAVMRAYRHPCILPLYCSFVTRDEFAPRLLLVTPFMSGGSIAHILRWARSPWGWAWGWAWGWVWGWAWGWAWGCVGGSGPPARYSPRYCKYLVVLRARPLLWSPGARASRRRVGTHAIPCIRAKRRQFGTRPAGRPATLDTARMTAQLPECWQVPAGPGATSSLPSTLSQILPP
jgi:hypothetical protein